MRILAGSLKYKRIKYIKDNDLRPTRNIVKKSFFDTVMPVIKGSIFLDMFAGVGSVGIEALSRGAKEAIFVDNAFRSINIIKDNVNTAGCKDRSVIIKSDAESFVENFDGLENVDIVYVDAPYGFDLSALLNKLFSNLNKNAIVCVEHKFDFGKKSDFGDFVNIKRRIIGKNILDYFGVADE